MGGPLEDPARADWELVRRLVTKCPAACAEVDDQGEGAEEKPVSVGSTSPAMSQASAGSELDRTGDSSVGMSFDDDFETAGGWSELQELLAFHSPASSVTKRKYGDASSRKKRKKVLPKSNRKHKTSAREERARKQTSKKKTTSPAMNVTLVTRGVPAPMKTSDE